MPRWAEKELAGWGRVCRATGRVARPERMAELAQLMHDADAASLLARGGGRSYGDAALNAAGGTVDMSRLDRFLDFDPASGLLVVEAGATFSEILGTFLPRGFIPPVMPGTGLVTMGGAVANDVHGKNHHQAGSFGQHLEWLDLRLPSGELRRIGPQDTVLYRATVGGVGLTGIIERVCLRLARVPSNAVHVRKRRVRDLDEHLAALADEQQRCPYVVGWIDALARGGDLGRGILEAATPSPEGVPLSRAATRTVPFDFPSIALNGVTVRAFNRLYYRRVPAAGSEGLQPYHKFLFPLDALHQWNRIYGKRGFHQFQCVLPFEAGGAAVRQLLEPIAASGQGSFLAVLKAMGQAGVGYLSFPRPGYTLALDFPNAPGAAELIGRLERIACDHGGRTYLAKDATLSADLMRRMYPQWPAMQAALAEIDPHGRMQSDLARRLELRAAP